MPSGHQPRRPPLPLKPCVTWIILGDGGRIARRPCRRPRARSGADPPASRLMEDEGGLSASPIELEIDALRAIVEGTARSMGEGFFASLVRHLASTIGVSYAFVAEGNVLGHLAVCDERPMPPEPRRLFI